MSVSIVELLWPGRRTLGRALRWAVIGFIVGYAIGLVDLGGSDIAKFLRQNEAAGATLVALAVVVTGAQRTIDARTFARVRRTHVELPDARSPMAWAYALALGSLGLVFGVAWASGTGPDEAAFDALATLVLVAAGMALYVGSAIVATVVARPPQTPPSSAERPHAYFADHPIASAEDDVLERGPVVAVLVEAILDLRNAAPGFVSLEGDWGSGKSSVVALARARLKAEPESHIVEVFSGYHFTTTDRVVEALVATIEHALNERYATFDAGREFRAYYKTLRPVLTSALPFGLPEPSEDRRTAKDRLEALLDPVHRPIVIFLEDLDRMRGEDLLILLGAVQLLGSIRGFVFVLVLDRDRCRWQLRRLVPDPADYLRKSIHAAIPLPEPAPHVLGEQFDKMLDYVLEARDVKLVPPPRLTIQSEDWLNLAPTLRHLKQLVNAYSTTLALLGGEINAFDALVANALDEAAPEVLDTIAADPWPWLDGLPQFQAFAAAMKYPSGTDRSAERKKALDGLALQRLRLDQVKEFIEVLFPAHRPVAEAQGGQHLSEWEYFRRYRERGVSSSFLRDHVVQNLIRDANVAGVGSAQQVVETRILSSSSRLELLNKLVVRAADFDPAVRLPVALACAAISNRLEHERLFFERTEVDRARVLIFSMLQLEDGDAAKQAKWIDSAIESATSLEFARGLVVFSRRDRNQILTDFSAFDQDRLARLLADTIRLRLEGGYDPFKSEPRAAPWILAALRDPGEASRRAVSLNGVAQVLDSARPYGTGGELLNTITWQTLLAGFDWKILADSLPEDRELTDLEKLLRDGPPKDESDDAPEQSKGG